MKRLAVYGSSASPRHGPWRGAAWPDGRSRDTVPGQSRAGAGFIRPAHRGTLIVEREPEALLVKIVARRPHRSIIFPVKKEEL